MEKLIERLTDTGLQFVWALVILIVGIIAIKIALNVVRNVLKKSKLDEALHTFITNTVKVLLIVLLAVSLLGYLKIPTGTFVAVLGACGAAVALALKDSLGNIAGGILILINKPFGRGDYVNLCGTEGSVDSIDLLVTTLKTVDNKVVTIPNGNITTSVIVNYSREELRRVDCEFSIGYGCSIQKAKDVIYNVIAANPKILANPEPVVLVASHGDNAVNLTCRAWCNTSSYWDVAFYLQENVKIAFDEHDIEIPYPQLDVHVIK